MRRYCLYMFEKPTEDIDKGIEKPPQRKNDEEAQERIDTVIDTKALSEEMESKPFKSEKLIEALARLVIELEDNITEYDTVLSDDASGRLVSLLLKKIIDKKREEVEKDKAQIYFIAPWQQSNFGWSLAIKKFIADRKDSLGKTLLVTEYIQSGKTIRSLMEILEQQNIDFDTAAVSILHESDDYIKKAGIKYGEAGGLAAAALCKATKFSGVEKTSTEKSIHPKRAEESDPENVRAARKDIDTLSEELSKLI